MAVDHQVTVAVVLGDDHDDGRLLAALSQRRQQPALSERLADAPIAGPVGETPVAWIAVRVSVCSKPGLVFSGGGGSLPESPVGSMRYALKWSFATRIISALITPMKSAPCTPKWSFATSQGSWFTGAGNRSDSGGWGTCVARRSILQATV